LAAETKNAGKVLKLVRKREGGGGKSNNFGKCVGIIQGGVQVWWGEGGGKKTGPNKQ